MISISDIAEQAVMELQKSVIQGQESKDETTHSCWYTADC
jgi:hypothetical protein